MARRNPGISPILSARGYAARVLWPKYTPDGGINSGSEIPVPPRNTLQSNQSNMIYRQNIATPFDKGRFTSNDRREEQHRLWVLSVRFLVARALNLPREQISGGEHRSLAFANRTMALYAAEFPQDELVLDVEKALVALYGDRANLYLSKKGKGTHRALVGPQMLEERDPMYDEIEFAMRSSRENPFTPVTQNAPGRIEVTSKRGKTLYMTENQILKMGSKMLADGEVERALGRSNPNAYKAGQRNNPRGSGEGPKRRGAFAEFEERMKRELGARGEYPVDSNGEPLANPYYSNPAGDRLSTSEMAQYKTQITQLLDSGESHGDVRKKFGLSYPKYMAILRSGRKTVSNPFGY